MTDGDPFTGDFVEFFWFMVNVHRCFVVGKHILDFELFDQGVSQVSPYATAVHH